MAVTATSKALLCLHLRHDFLDCKRWGGSQAGDSWQVEACNSRWSCRP